MAWRTPLALQIVFLLVILGMVNCLPWIFCDINDFISAYRVISWNVKSEVMQGNSGNAQMM